MSKKRRRHYDKAFKKRAVALLEAGRTIREAAEELGLPISYLYRWRQEALARQRDEEELKQRLRASQEPPVDSPKPKGPTEQQRRQWERELAEARARYEALVRALDEYHLGGGSDEQPLTNGMDESE